MLSVVLKALGVAGECLASETQVTSKNSKALGKQGRNLKCELVGLRVEQVLGLWEGGDVSGRLAMVECVGQEMYKRSDSQNGITFIDVRFSVEDLLECSGFVIIALERVGGSC